MVRRPGVSIIIDSYNHERFVEATIRSAMVQDYEPLQVIVIDDGSPDRSQEIIKSFGSSIEAVFQENQGQVAACRNALALAKHDIVIFLDSDDLLEPHAAATVAGAWRDGVSKVQYCLHVIDEEGVSNGNIFPKFSANLTPDAVRAEMIRTGSYPDSPTSGNAYDRRFLERALPLLPRRNGFDGELNGIAPLYGEVISLNQPLGSYRIHGANDFAQSQLDVDRFADYLRHSEARLAFIGDHYRSMGQGIADDALERDLKYQEYALVVAKLGKPRDGEPKHLLKVAATAVMAALTSPHTLIQRAYRALSIAAVTIAPAMLAAKLIEQRFIPGRRAGWITRLATAEQRPATKRGRPASVANGLKRPTPSSSHV
ncbi:MAG: glycosyltransferase family 2 protein [Alphaproteobacteria bacterium]|nr:glycosyltransferase family 2 protein [Alphaproteobacteria bacterium]